MPRRKCELMSNPNDLAHTCEKKIAIQTCEQPTIQKEFKKMCDECGKLLRQCFYKVLNRTEASKPLLMLKQSERKDVILLYGDFRQNSNVPRKVFYGATHFTWGYSGNGPLDLAANILYHFTDGNLKLVEKLFIPFVSDAVRHLPMQESVLLSAEFIEAWIEENKGKVNDPELYQVRFQLAKEPYVWLDDKLVPITPFVNEKGGV